MEQKKSNYRFSYDGKPDYAMLNIELAPQKGLVVEASAMAYMDTNIVMETRLRGGLGRFLTGESLFINDFSAKGGPGIMGISPASPGEIQHVYLENNEIYLQNNSFLAASPELKIESKWQGMIKGFFSGESIFLIRVSGTGDLWFNTFGSLVEIDVTESYVVDTGCIAAFSAGLTYEIGRIGGYKSLFFSGEGFVCKFRGQGKIWLQSRQPRPYAWLFKPYRPSKN